MDIKKTVIENELIKREDFVKKIKKIYFVDLSDYITSAIAKLCALDGFIVSGYCEYLGVEAKKDFQKVGISVHKDHSPDKVKKCDLVVKSTDYPLNSPEIMAAGEAGIPVVSEYKILGNAMNVFRKIAGVMGTRGKSSMISMVIHVLLENEKSPSFICGSEIYESDKNFSLQNKDFFIYELNDNSNDIFETRPDIAVFLNMEYDNTDFYDGVQTMKKTYKRFGNIPFEKAGERGLVIYNKDDVNLDSITYDGTVKTYGINNPDATYNATEVTEKNGYYKFEILNDHLESLGIIKLNVPGKHHIYNALAAFAICRELGLEDGNICSSLSSYAGVKRKFEFIGRSENGVPVYLDYAHNPKEIENTITTLRQMTEGKITVIYEPNSYRRLRDLYSSYIQALNNADMVIMLDVNSPYERETYGLSTNDMSSEMKRAFYSPSYGSASAIARSFTSGGDVILVIGEGEIYKVTEMIME